MAKLSSVKRDVEKASQGIWRTFEGIDFCIARIDNPDAKKELRRLSKLERATRRGKVDDDAAEKHITAVVAKHVIKDWRNLEDDDGKPIPYSVETASKIIADPAFAELRDWIITIATEDEAFRAETIEATAKN